MFPRWQIVIERWATATGAAVGPRERTQSMKLRKWLSLRYRWTPSPPIFDQERHRLGLQLAAIDVDLPFGPLERHAHLLLVGDEHGQAVLVDGFEGIVGGRVPERVRR